MKTELFTRPVSLVSFVFAKDGPLIWVVTPALLQVLTVCDIAADEIARSLKPPVQIWRNPVAPTFNKVEEWDQPVPTERTEAEVNHLIALLQGRQALLQAQAELEMVEEIAKVLFPYNYSNIHILQMQKTRHLAIRER